MLRLIILGCAIILVGCAEQVIESENFAATPIVEETPRLLSPIDGAVLKEAGELLLRWDWIYELDENQVFDVRVWRSGDANLGITWSKDREIDIADWLSNHGPGEYYWSIAVINGGERGEVLQIITDQASPFKFELLPQAVIDIPANFSINEFAYIPQAAQTITVIAFDPQSATDVLYALTSDGKVFALEDTTGDHYADSVKLIFSNEDSLLEHAVGMAFRDGVMYISDAGRISTLTDSDDDGYLDHLTTIVDGLPALEYVWHSNNGIAFGPDDKLYITVGAGSDHGPLEHPLEASILRVNPDGSELEVFARGFRNPYDLTFSPEGNLFTADNGPDTGPDDLPDEERVEELNHVRQGLNYGFPDVFGIPTRPNPAFTNPVTEFLPHTANSGLVYYTMYQFPQTYWDGIFVAQWNGQVVFVRLTPIEDGTFSGEWKRFADFGPTRPVDVTVGRDGSLYVAEWHLGRVYRIEYVPPAFNGPEALDS